ncbi:MAG: hypothetical protein IKF71_00410 [Bacilli bacterium]|nr:hypothetical protein [Bacilli bacterium]
MKSKHMTIIGIIILVIAFVMIEIGFVVASKQEEPKGEKSPTKTNISKDKMVLSKEERYSNNKLIERISYSYDSKGNVKSAKLKYDCKDYEHCTYMETAARGLYKYKYKHKNGKLHNLVKIDLYTKDGVSTYYEDDDLNPIKKYGYDAVLMNREEKDIIVTYEYDSQKRISKRIGSQYGKERSTVTFEYDENNNIINQNFHIKGGTEYHNQYTYDEQNNVTSFSVDYIIKEEDEIIYDSDGFEGLGNEGKLVINYNYDYKEDLIKNIKVNVNFNNTYQEEYIVNREYDENKNLVLEKIVRTDSERPGERTTYLRKLYYEESPWNKNTSEYTIKKYQLETQSDSLVEYLYKEDNWLACYHFFMY